VAAVVAAVAAVVAGGWWLQRAGWLTTGRADSATVPPAQLEGLPLVRLQRGEEALQAINRLHRTAIEIVDGYVAAYGNAHEQVIVWWARAASEAKARELVDVMTEKMAASPLFSRPQPVTVGGRRLHFTVGAGMRNYYWVSGQDVYWAGVVSSREASIVEALLRGVPDDPGPPSADRFPR